MLVANSASGELRIPDWVPPNIHRSALDLYRRSLGAFEGKPAAMIKRLICDERMKVVWNRLRREGGEGLFAELFHITVTLMQHPILMQPSPSPSYADLATRLRDDARAIEKRKPQKTFGRCAGSLARAAKTYDALDKAQLPRQEIVRAVCDLASLLDERFGSPHYQAAATIASVALDRVISEHDVRNWLRAVKMSEKD
jgi:hypothetical protein